MYIHKYTSLCAYTQYYTLLSNSSTVYTCRYMYVYYAVLHTLDTYNVHVHVHVRVYVDVCMCVCALHCQSSSITTKSAQKARNSYNHEVNVRM